MNHHPKKPRIVADWMPALLLITGCVVLGLAGRMKAQQNPIPTTFTNLQVMPKSTPRSELVPLMRAFTRSLGVRCEHCHLGEGDDLSTFDFASDARPAKVVARKMMAMVEVLNNEPLANTGGVTCVTCHGGSRLPGRLPREKWEALADTWPATLPEDQKLTMSVYSASLGVGCDHCHDTTDWKSPVKPAFATAQRMGAMFAVFPRFMPPTARTQCFMCHKGSAHPSRAFRGQPHQSER